MTYSSTDNYDWYLKMGALPNFTKVTGDSLEFWDNMMKHPNLDAWWKAREYPLRHLKM